MASDACGLKSRWGTADGTQPREALERFVVNRRIGQLLLTEGIVKCAKSLKWGARDAGLGRVASKVAGPTPSETSSTSEPAKIASAPGTARGSRMARARRSGPATSVPPPKE